MQPAGDLVAAVTELASRMQHCESQGDRRDLLLRMILDRDAATVISHLDPALRQDADQDHVAVSGKCLVNCVVHHFIDQVVQAALPRRADVHARPLPYGFQALEDGNRLRVVGARLDVVDDAICRRVGPRVDDAGVGWDRVDVVGLVEMLHRRGAPVRRAPPGPHLVVR